MIGVGPFIGVLIITFLLGSVPSGVVIGKLFYHTDIRKVGSGNIGTTNAIRAIGKKGGYIVFALDFGKGVLSGLIGLWIATACLQGQPLSAASLFSVNDCLAAAFLGCAFGHIFSPWLKFRGGKGIAVSGGCMLVTFGPLGTLAELMFFAVLVATTKYVSIGSIAAAALCPFLGLYLFWGDWIAVALCAVVGGTVIWAHRQNIARLKAGSENKIGRKKGDEVS